MISDTLMVNEIFSSISGESGGGFPQGSCCTFIRLQGCNLRCNWCDTPYSQKLKTENRMSINDIVNKVLELKLSRVIITGGEPLVQYNLLKLCNFLLDLNCTIQIETNGSWKIPENFPNTVAWVYDYKLNSSGMSKKMMSPFDFVTTSRGRNVQLKFVIGDMGDMDEAIKVMTKIRCFYDRFPFLISPIDANGKMIQAIIDKIHETRPLLLNDVIFSLQIHKLFDFS